DECAFARYGSDAAFGPVHSWAAHLCRAQEGRYRAAVRAEPVAVSGAVAPPPNLPLVGGGTYRDCRDAREPPEDPSPYWSGYPRNERAGDNDFRHSPRHAYCRGCAGQC